MQPNLFFGWSGASCVFYGFLGSIKMPLGSRQTYPLQIGTSVSANQSPSFHIFARTDSQILDHQFAKQVLIDHPWTILHNSCQDTLKQTNRVHPSGLLCLFSAFNVKKNPIGIPHPTTNIGMNKHLPDFILMVCAIQNHTICTCIFYMCILL